LVNATFIGRRREMRRKRTLIVALLLIFYCGVATAQEGASAENDIFALKNFTGSVALTTDYLFRGLSQTDEDPAMQGSFDYNHDTGIYLGVWGSGVDEGVSEGNVEFDYYGGFTRELFEDFSYDVSFIYYHYPGGGSNNKPDYYEVHLGLSYAFAFLPTEPVIAGGYNYSPDFFGEDDDAHYVNGTLDLSFPYGFGLGFEIGYQYVKGDETTGNNQGESGKDGFDYLHWRIGLYKELLGFGLDLSYHDTDDSGFLGDVADERLVFTVSRSF
jgi:uncharacterized protein (TIGR02001 family)